MSGSEILVVGSGFGGLGMAIRLKAAGYRDFLVLERADRLGGTWRDNHYPGAACDVESHLYSFSFEPNPRWSRAFAPQAEILAYLEACAAKYDLHPHLRFGHGVARARFQERVGLWRVELENGEALEAKVLITATGGLSRPAYPEIPGLDRFQGKVFHSARWDHSFPLEGKTVAVIGTGASAIQIVPAIALRVARLQVYQRTPPWVMPKPDRELRALERSVFRKIPFLQRLVRLRQYWTHELRAPGFTRVPRLLKWASKMAEWNIAKSIADPELRARLTPRYTMGCKRVLLSNDYYPAIARENVELVTDPIREITSKGIVTGDGKERPVDLIVLATGFQAAEMAAPFEVKGRNGLDLNAAWLPGAEAYLGTTVTGFPNLFLIVGPNTGLGHSSMVFMIESQVAYILDALETMKAEEVGELEVLPEVQERYNRRLQARLDRTVWSTGGCMSWYQTRTGRNTTLWPGFTFEYRMRTRRFDPRDYRLVRPEAAAEPAALVHAGS